MSTTRYATLIGLALGAIWALTDFGDAVLAGVVAAFGFLVGLVLEGRLDVQEFLGNRQPGERRANQL